MAQSERFYFWRGYYDALRKMPTDEQRGEFVMAVCAYAFDGVEPDFGGDALLDICWSLVADGTRESVRKGVEQSRRGSRGGRPAKDAKTTAKSTAKSGVKSGAKTTAKSGALSGVKSGAESGAESEGKRRESLLLTEKRDGASRSAPGGAALAPRDSVDAWCAAGGVPSPPVPSVPPEGA